MLCLSSGKQMGSISIARPIFKQEVNVQKNKVGAMKDLTYRFSFQPMAPQRAPALGSVLANHEFHMHAFHAYPNP